jgi:hypothetical protein
MKVAKNLRHTKKCLAEGKDFDCVFCRTFNYGYWDARSDIENSRPRKWDNDGNLISILDEKKGFAKKHYNPSYVKGYCKAYEFNTI